MTEQDIFKIAFSTVRMPPHMDAAFGAELKRSADTARPEGDRVASRNMDRARAIMMAAKKAERDKYRDDVMALVAQDIPLKRIAVAIGRSETFVRNILRDEAAE